MVTPLVQDPLKNGEQATPLEEKPVRRRPDPDNPVDPCWELIEDDGLTWERRAEIEARGRMKRRLRGEE